MSGTEVGNTVKTGGTIPHKLFRKEETFMSKSKPPCSPFYWKPSKNKAGQRSSPCLATDKS